MERIVDLNEAIKAHSEWKMKLRGAISTQTSLDVQAIAKDDCCALGKWLHGESKARFGALPAHTDCMRLHANFHKEAAKIAKAINDKHYAEAEAMLGTGTPYATASQSVVIGIGTLKRAANL